MTTSELSLGTPRHRKNIYDLHKNDCNGWESNPQPNFITNIILTLTTNNCMRQSLLSL